MTWYLLRKWLTKAKNFRRYQKVQVSGLESRVSSDVSKIPSRDQREQLSQVSKRITRCNLRIQTKILRNVNSILSLTPSTKAPCESAHSFSPLVSKNPFTIFSKITLLRKFFKNSLQEGYFENSLKFLQLVPNLTPIRKLLCTFLYLCYCYP